MGALKENRRIRDTAAAVKPSGFLDYRDYLKTLYCHLKSAFGRYSYLRFAEDLGFSATNILHHVIQGRRPLTAKAAETVIAALDLDAVEGRYLSTLVQYANARTPESRDELFRALYSVKQSTLRAADDRDTLLYFSEWYHPVIGELTRLEHFESDPRWISSRLFANVRPAQVQKSLELLERLGLIAFDAKRGRHVRTAKDLSTGPEARGMAIAQYHFDMIQQGREAIALVDQDDRDISGLTLCLSNEGMRRLKEMIHAFQQQLLAEEERSDRKEQVCQVNIQLFPFTKKIKG